MQTVLFYITQKQIKSFVKFIDQKSVPEYFKGVHLESVPFSNQITLMVVNKMARIEKFSSNAVTPYLQGFIPLKLLQDNPNGIVITIDGNGSIFANDILLTTENFRRRIEKDGRDTDLIPINDVDITGVNDLTFTSDTGNCVILSKKQIKDLMKHSGLKKSFTGLLSVVKYANGGNAPLIKFIPDIKERIYFIL